MTERWLPVVGYEGIYEVSDEGRVRVLARIDARGWRRRAAFITPWPRSSGHYLCVSLCTNAVVTKRYIHELVIEAFTGPRPQPGNQVRHLDGDRLNNTAANLAWGTPAENSQDTIRHGRSKRPLTPACSRGHAYTPENTYWKPRGERRCRTCHNADQARRNRKQVAA